MKAIFIDTPDRTVSAIDADVMHLDRRFRPLGTRSIVPVDMAAVVISPNAVLFYDRNGILKHPADFFYIDGFAGVIFGKALLLGHVEGGGPTDATLTLEEAEALVAFHHKRSPIQYEPKQGTRNDRT